MQRKQHTAKRLAELSAQLRLKAASVTTEESEAVAPAAASGSNVPQTPAVTSPLAEGPGGSGASTLSAGQPVQSNEVSA